MTSINGIGNPEPAGPIQKVVQQPILKELPADTASPQTRPAVKLELSGMSHLLHALKSSQDVRVDKIEQIKAQIQAGTYEDEQKLDAAADKLLDELNQ
jgi:anti-sigma28 factor (negative regulator of flagellin synthesis)